MADSAIEWWKTVQDHYDRDLDALAMCHRAHHAVQRLDVMAVADRQVEAVAYWPETKANWVEGSKPFIDAYEPIVAALGMRLHKKGLPHD